MDSEFREKVLATHGMTARQTDKLVKRVARPAPTKSRSKPPKTKKRIPHVLRMKLKRAEQLARKPNAVARVGGSPNPPHSQAREAARRLAKSAA